MSELPSSLAPFQPKNIAFARTSEGPFGEFNKQATSIRPRGIIPAMCTLFYGY